MALLAKANNLSAQTGQVIFLKQGEPITLQGEFDLFRPLPVLSDSGQMDLNYEKIKTLRFPEDSASPYINVGTQYLMPTYYTQRISFIPSPPHWIIRSCFQVVVSQHDGYLGYLEELLHVPMLDSPGIQGPYGHQTDNRLGVNSTSMVIYARRRQGVDLPYVPFFELTRFLEPTDSLFPGAILQYGDQFSNLYEDRGEIGILDEDDLLIHALNTKAEIIRLGSTPLSPADCKMMWWKID